MAPTIIHQAIHGYRDGHRLLSGSIVPGAEALRAMLVLSDMSGPSMQPGFDEYLTAYPLPGSELFVFAKTWYAAEMQRPGCVWTHSLLISREHISEVSARRLLATLRRPQLDDVEGKASAPIIVDDATPAAPVPEGFADRAVATALVSAVLGQARPVIVAVENAEQLESAFLRLWDGLWPSAKAGFSFCTGALMPRAVAGALMDIQAVPRSVPSSQFRKSAGSALILDLRARAESETWVEVVLQSLTRAGPIFRSWMEAAAGAEASRGAVPALMPIFGHWHAGDWSAHAVLGKVLGAPGLEPVARTRLVRMVFDRAAADGGAAQRRELLQELCGQREGELSSLTSLLKEQTSRLFDESRSEGCSLAISLLGAELTDVGEEVLRTAVLSLTPSDLETFGDAQAPFLPTIVSANPTLASAPVLWSRAGFRSREILAQLDASKLSDQERSGVVDAVLASGRDAPVEALVRFAGDVAVWQVLSALAAEKMSFSTQWRAALTGRSDAVVAWLEGQTALSSKELEVASHFVSPAAHAERLAKAWEIGVSASSLSISPRVAAFGLALALSENGLSPLLAPCFQPTFDALASSRLEYEEWDWLREHAPPVSWWREWDKCERVAAALARRLEREHAPLEAVFGILRGRAAIRKVTSVLGDHRSTRPYLKSLRRATEASPGIGAREQRDALLKDW